MIKTRPVLRRLLRFAAAGMLLLGTTWAHADFIVESGQSRLSDGIIITDARLRLSITGDPEEALSKGIGLTLIVETELQRASLAALFFGIEKREERFQIEYQGLSNRFQLTRLRDGSKDDFATLSETLGSIERYSARHPLPEGVTPRDRLQIRLRVTLDRGALPGPLRLIALVLEDWRLDSSWSRWPVTLP